MGASSQRRTHRATVAAIVLSIAQGASAQSGDVAAAREAYDRGAAAYDAGEYGLAATQLARADVLAPNDVALELALKAAVKGGDALLAMELAARADGRKGASLHAARDDARAKMSGRTGRVTLKCAPGTACVGRFDDHPFPIGEPRWVLAGAHDVVISAEGEPPQRFAVRVDPGATVPVQAAAAVVRPTPPPERDAPAAREGAHPAWFWVAAFATLGLGGGTIASALDTKNKHDAFAARPSASLSEAGSDAELRTNLFLAGTVTAMVVTAAIGLFVVRWGSAPKARAVGGGS